MSTVPGHLSFATVAPPAMLTVRCPGCGRERMTMAHDPDGVARAARCDRCGADTELLSASRSGPACPCCGM